MAIRTLGQVFASRVEIADDEFLRRYAPVKSFPMRANGRDMAVPLSQDLVGMRLVQLHALAREFDRAESAAAELKETPVAEELRRMFTATWGNDVPGRPPVTAGPADLGSGSSWGKRPDWMRDGVRAALLVGYEDLEVVGESHYQDNLRRLRSPESQTEAFKYDVAYPAYGTPQSEWTELDHLVPLELGGSNDATNLWPEYPPSPNPKDKVEDALNAAVCEGRVSLVAAQNAIASDWMTAEKKLGIGPVINPGGGSGGGGSKRFMEQRVQRLRRVRPLQPARRHQGHRDGE